MSATLVPSGSAPSGFDASSTSSSTQLGSVYVGDLNPDVNEKDLLDVFKVCGNVRSVRIPRDITTGNSLCYGYVNFDSMEAANKAVAELNGVRIKNVRPCRVMHQEHDSSKRNSLEGKIFVKGLKDDVDTRVLQGFMSRYGDIYSCVVKTDNEGKSLGYGFCQFQNPEDAKKAIEDKRDSKPALGEFSSINVFLPPDKRPSSRDQYTNVYIKGFDRDASEEVIKGLFKDCGEVTSWFFAREDDTREDSNEGNLLGFCFANFKDHETALKVVEKFAKAEPIVWIKHVPQDAEASKKYIEEHPDEKNPEVFISKIFAARAMSKEERKKLLSTEHPRNFPAMDEKRCIFIKGISPEMTEEDLVEYFSKFGELDTITRGGKQVPSVHIPRNKENGNAIRGIAYVNFKNPDDCTKALTAGEVRIKEKRLQVVMAMSKEKRAQLMISGAGTQGTTPMFMVNPSQMPMPMPWYAMMYGNPNAVFFNPQMMGHMNPSDIHQSHNGNYVGFSGANRGFGYNNTHKGGNNGNRRTQNRGNNNLARGGRGRGAGDVKDRRNGPNNQPRHKGMAQEAAAAKAGEVTTNVAVPAHIPEPVEVSAPVEAELSPEDLKQKLGEKIYERVMNMFDNDEPRWGKLTGMLIESIEPAELQRIVDDEQKLDDKIREANKFYEEHVNRPNPEGEQ